VSRATPAIEVLSELPPEFLIERSRQGVLAVHREIAPALGEAGFGLESDGRMAVSDLAGRRSLGEFTFGGTRLLVRRFTHGGLLRFVTRERFTDPARPFRELILASRLRTLGISTPEVLAARARQAGLFGFHLDLVTRRIEGTAALGELWSHPRLSPAARKALARGAARLIASMHACGMVHVDLNARNLIAAQEDLARGDAPMWVVDLDRCWLEPAPLGAKERLAILRRFYRSFVRLARGGTPMPTRGDCARFLCAYDPSAWRANWRAIARAHTASAPLHDFGWMIERGLQALQRLLPGSARARR
jgi:hypothetical protein